jgi:hypothetical protein
LHRNRASPHVKPFVSLAVTPNEPSDWDNHSTDLLCPLCKYNLRHLTTARCPECGFTFSWQELLDAEKHRHPYLFEHGRRRNVGTFWKTYWTTCRPRKFWSDLNPAKPVHLARLMVYWMIATGLMSCCLCGSQISDIARASVLLERQGAAYRAMFVPIPNQPGFYTEGNISTNTPLTSAKDVVTGPRWMRCGRTRGSLISGREPLRRVTAVTRTLTLRESVGLPSSSAGRG